MNSIAQVNESSALLFLIFASHNVHHMDSRRQLKIGSVIKEAFADILSREGKSIYGNAFVTVTNVKVTSDLSLARFYLSIYNSENPEEVVLRFDTHKYELKRKLSEKLRHQLRVIPEVEFFRDDTLDYVSHIDEVFKKIKEEELALQHEVLASKKKPRSKSTARKPKKAAKTK